MDISDKKENRILKYVAIYLTKKMLFFVIFFKNSVQCISHQNFKYFSMVLKDCIDLSQITQKHQ